VIAYVRALWNGALPLSRVFWLDMLAVGTLVNVVTFLVMIALFAGKAPTWIGLTVLLLPIPYNVLLFAAVWRSAANEKADWAWFARLLASVWLIAAIVV
jgi:hypothetical protein